MVKFQTFPNPHIVAYHVRGRLIKSSILSFDSMAWGALERADSGLLLRILRRLLGRGAADYERFECQERQRNAPLIDDLFAIEGIQAITLHPYSINITKGQAFTWKELDPQISAILSKHGFEE